VGSEPFLVIQLQALFCDLTPCFMGLMVFFPPRVVVTSPQLLVALSPGLTTISGRLNHHSGGQPIPELLPKLQVAPSQPWSIVQSACLVMVNPGFYQIGAPVDVPFAQFWDSSCTKKSKVWGFPTKNKMQPTNPNAHRYVNGTDFKAHGYAVTHAAFLQWFI
jgi:hypothetical protein